MSAAEPQWDGVEEESGGGLPEFLLDPVGVARRRWLPAALCFVVGLVTTVVLTLVWKPSYLAQATILITSQQIPREFVTSTVQEDSLANVNAMIGEVLSAENLSKLIDDLKLFQDESADTARIDLVTKMRSRIDAAPESTPNPRSRNTEAIVYGISYESDQGQEAARVANALAALFVEASISRRNTQARLTTQFLRKALENDEKELREITRQISEFRQENRGLLPEEQQTLLRKLELLSSQRDSLSQQIAAKQDRIVSISSQGGDAVLSENEILLGELRRELARQSAVLTDEHPNVIALRDRIARLQAETTTSSGLPTSSRTSAARSRGCASSSRMSRGRSPTSTRGPTARRSSRSSSLRWSARRWCCARTISTRCARSRRPSWPRTSSRRSRAGRSRSSTRPRPPPSRRWREC